MKDVNYPRPTSGARIDGGGMFVDVRSACSNFD